MVTYTAVHLVDDNPKIIFMPQSTSARAHNGLSQPPPPKISQKYIQLRPKEGALLINLPNSYSDFKRRKHALSQKNQRDRLKMAFDQMAHVLRTSGVSNGQKGGLCTKVDLLETAVEYIQHLQSEINGHKSHKISEG